MKMMACSYWLFCPTYSGIMTPSEQVLREQTQVSIVLRRYWNASQWDGVHLLARQRKNSLCRVITKKKHQDQGRMEILMLIAHRYGNPSLAVDNRLINFNYVNMNDISLQPFD